MKELREKVASYEVRSNRKFFDVEPLAEENAALREEIAARDARIAELNLIVNPPPSLFYSSRTKEDGSLLGGRRCSDDWELLSLGMSTLMISPNNMKATVEAVARFFKLNLPTE